MKPSHGLTLAAFICALAAPAFVALGLFGMKYGWFGFGVSAFLVDTAAFPAALLGAALGLVAAVYTLVERRGGVVWPLAACLIGVGAALAGSMQNAADAKFPPIHDAATSWTDPVMPTPHLLQVRGADADPVAPAPMVGGSGALAGDTVADVNAKTCPAAVPLTLMVTAPAAYDRALKAVKDRRLAIVTDDKAAGVIEATATNFWGMKDDVMIRVRPEGAGARVDIRSISRRTPGRTDRGHNCRRLTQLRSDIGG